MLLIKRNWAKIQNVSRIDLKGVLNFDPKLLNMELGTVLPIFDLKGTDGLKHSSSDFNDSQVLVVIFTCNHCPYARAYIQRISKLVDEFTRRSVSIVAINSNDPVNYPEDSYEKMLPMASLLNLSELYLFE